MKPGEKLVGKCKDSPLFGSTVSEVRAWERHLKILKTIKENEPIEISNLPCMTGFPDHIIRYSLGVLEKNGLIQSSEIGATTTSRVYDTLGTLDDALKNISIMLKSFKRA